MTTPAPVDGVMNTSTDAAADLHCPLCEYNLRGLAEPRCPECGFAFDWDELRAAGRTQHPWLFENARRRRLRSLWMTWWRGRRPWRFWREVTPAHPVDARRLAIYWATVLLVTAVTLSVPLPHGAWTNFQLVQRYSRYTFYTPNSRSPPTAPLLLWLANEAGRTWDAVTRRPSSPTLVLPLLIVGAWPWLSAAALMVFRASLRQVRIRPVHVLRVAVYGCDVTVAAVLFVLAFVPVDRSGVWRGYDAVPLLYLAAGCGALATVRMGFGYARYLRFHRPLLTVLASQVFVVLAVAVVLARTTNLSELFR